MAKIVTANYLHDDDNKWRMRNVDAHRNASESASAIVATEVKFRQAAENEPESGFGCGVVAECSDAQEVESITIPATAKLAQVVFSFDKFLTLLNEERVTECRALYLFADGTMLVAI